MANDPRISINPEFFFVPDDVIDVRAETDSDGVFFPHEEYQPDVIVDLDDALFDEADPVSGDDSSETLQPPQWMTVVAQTVRMGADGRSVVDVTLECEDVPGAVDYELRVAK